MSICIYGEMGIDWLIGEEKGNIFYRMGGAGLYASIAAAKQCETVDFLTMYGPEANEYCISGWQGLGISFANAEYNGAYSLPKYFVTGFQNYGRKVSCPLTEVKLELDFQPTLPVGCSGLLVFPFNHSLPIELCKSAYEAKMPIILDPKPNANSLESAIEILKYVSVLLVNEEEIRKLSGCAEISGAIKWVKSTGIKKIVVKRGIKGCQVVDDEKEYLIAAYHSDAVCTLGSGDIFAGAFAALYMQSNDLLQSVNLASCIAADFIEHTETEAVIGREAVEYQMRSRSKISLEDIKKETIYLAGPFFSQQEKLWVEKVVNHLRDAGFNVLSPSEAYGVLAPNSSTMEKEKVFCGDMALLEQASVVVALLDHSDTGTCFEIGYAYHKKMPIIGLNTSKYASNIMIEFGCGKICKTIKELISELYRRCARIK